MSRTITLVDALALGDLQVLLERAARIEDGSVRLIAGSGVLAVYVAVFYPIGLLDESPTVLGLRTFAITGTDSFDAVVPIGSLLVRIERAQAQATENTEPVTLSLPMEVHTVTWTAISPPRGGWTTLPGTSSDLLKSVADAGIREVAAALPPGAGEQVVHRVRAEVWSRPIERLEHVPAGAGFAGLGLGFLEPGEVVAIFETGPWTRLTTKRGHILIRRRAWTLAR